jgi:hypothetical protein
MHISSSTRCLARVAGSFLIVATLVLLPSPARSEARWGFAGFGGYSSYAMGDVNDVVDALNVALLEGGSPLRMDPIDGGPTYGLGVRLHTSDNVRFALDYERLTGSSSVEDFSGSITFNVPADAITASVSYFIPSEGKARFGFGAGLGLYMSAGSMEVGVAGQGSESLDWEGSGVGFHLLGQSDITLSPALKLELGAGYRSAKVGWEMEGADTGEELDWGGFASRIGLAFYP